MHHNEQLRFLCGKDIPFSMFLFLNCDHRLRETVVGALRFSLKLLISKVISKSFGTCLENGKYDLSVISSEINNFAFYQS